jgi:hypothetical protein
VSDSSGKTARFAGAGLFLVVTTLVLGADPGPRFSSGNQRGPAVSADGLDPSWNNSTSGEPGPEM